MSNQQHPKHRLTAEEVEVRIWGFVVVAVTLILCFIVVALLYSVTFVTQPIKSMAPIDQAYTKMLNDIVLLVVGGIGGVMSRKGVGALAEAMAGPTPQPPCGPVLASGATMPMTNVGMVQPTAMPNFNWMGYKNPDLDETWTPGPPPTTPPEHQEPDEDRLALAIARQEVH
jgi:hypothetical protein